jgi:hypothetical protein
MPTSPSPLYDRRKTRPEDSPTFRVRYEPSIIVRYPNKQSLLRTSSSTLQKTLAPTKVDTPLCNSSIDKSDRRLSPVARGI